MYKNNFLIITRFYSFVYPIISFVLVIAYWRNIHALIGLFALIVFLFCGYLFYKHSSELTEQEGEDLNNQIKLNRIIPIWASLIVFIILFEPLFQIKWNNEMKISRERIRLEMAKMPSKEEVYRKGLVSARNSEKPFDRISPEYLGETKFGSPTEKYSGDYTWYYCKGGVTMYLNAEFSLHSPVEVSEGIVNDKNARKYSCFSREDGYIFRN